jgi:hypothetical protein
MMKRFLNKLRRFKISKIANSSYKYELNDSTTPPDENELFIGQTDITDDETEVGLFVHKIIEEESYIFSVSYDDFSYDFLNKENNRLNKAYEKLTENIDDLENIPTIPDETNGGDE